MPTLSSAAPDRRFVVLLHFPGPTLSRTEQPHLDWMFEWDGQLRTWASPVIDWESTRDVLETACEPLAPHRIAYLDYEGEVSRGRGTVVRQLAGVYRWIDDDADCFRAELRWERDARRQTAKLEVYRSFLVDEVGRLDESRESWRLRFSPG